MLPARLDLRDYSCGVDAGKEQLGKALALQLILKRKASECLMARIIS